MLPWRMVALIVLCGLHAVFVSSSYQDSESSSIYDFSYEVLDAQKGQDFGHSESRQVGRTNGEYYVLLPDGRRQIVNYYADETGFYPAITYQESSTHHLSFANNPEQWKSDFFNSSMTNNFGKKKNVVTTKRKFQSNFLKHNFEQDSLPDLSDDSKSQIISKPKFNSFELEPNRWKGSVSIDEITSFNSEMPQNLLDQHSHPGRDETPASLFLKVPDQLNYESRDPSNLFVNHNEPSLMPPNSNGQFSFSSPKVSSIVTFHELEKYPKPLKKESVNYQTEVTPNILPISKVAANDPLRNLESKAFRDNFNKVLSSNDQPLFPRRGKGDNTFSFRSGKKPRIFKVIALPNSKLSIPRNQIDKSTENIRSNDGNVKVITLHLPSTPIGIKENVGKVIKHISLNNVHKIPNIITEMEKNKPGINNNYNSHLKSDQSTSVTNPDNEPSSNHKNTADKGVTEQHLEESLKFNEETGEVHFKAQKFPDPPDYENLQVPKYSFTSGHSQNEAYGDQRRVPKTNKVKSISGHKFFSGNSFHPKYPSHFPPKKTIPSLSQTQNNKPNFQFSNEQKPNFFHPSFRPRFYSHSSVPFKPYKPPRRKLPPTSQTPSKPSFLSPPSQHDLRPSFPSPRPSIPNATPPVQFPFKPNFPSPPSKSNFTPTSQLPSKPNFLPPSLPPPRPRFPPPSVPEFLPPSQPPPFQPNFPPPSKLPPTPNSNPPSSTPSPIPRRFVPEGPLETDEPTSDLPFSPTPDVNPNDLVVPKIVPVIIPVEGDLPFNEDPLSENDFSDLGDYPDEDYL